MIKRKGLQIGLGRMTSPSSLSPPLLPRWWWIETDKESTVKSTDIFIEGQAGNGKETTITSQCRCCCDTQHRAQQNSKMYIK